MRRVQAFLVHFVAPAIMFAILGYAFVTGISWPLRVLFVACFGLPALGLVWWGLTANKRQALRDRQKEQEFLNENIGK